VVEALATRILYALRVVPEIDAEHAWTGANN
jgi:hypothetical protein